MRRSHHRRNPVKGREAIAAAGIAAAAGVLCATFGLSPAGQQPVDALLVTLAVATMVWAAASAPWWLLAVAAGIGAAFADGIAFMAVGVAAMVAAVFIGARRANLAWARSAIAAGTAMVLCHLDTGTTFGVSAAVGITAAAFLTLYGIRRRPRDVRRRSAVVIAGLAIGTVVALAGFGLSAAAAKNNLLRGNDSARDALQLLSKGNVPEARAAFDAAARSFAVASNTLDKPWTQPARLIPVAAQHRDSATMLARGAADATARIATTLEAVDFDSVTIVNGRIDLDAVRALEAPLTELRSVLDELDDVVTHADSPWLASPLQSRLTDVQADIAKYQEQGDTALEAVHLAPAILGADAPRVYFVAFCTPAEARGTLGFMGNWAEITVTDGQIAMTRFGRTADLNKAGGPDRRIVGMDEFIARYGGYGLSTGPGGTTSDTAWSMITMSPDFPSIGQAIAQLYPQSGGQKIDGAFALDPAALAGLLSFTGPITADGVPIELTSKNLSQYLNVDQYIAIQDNDERIDSLESVAQATISQTLAGTFPGPQEMGKTFGTIVRDGHLAAWMVAPTEQDLASVLEMDHGLPQPSPNGDFVLAINNGSGNKIDAYSSVDVDYGRHFEPATLELSGTIQITLSNNAPQGGLPRYVLGNVVGEVQGSNTSYVSIYLPFSPTSMDLDGVPVDVEASAENGWHVASAFVQVLAGEQKVLSLTYRGHTDSPPTGPPMAGMPDAFAPPTLHMTG